MVVIEHDGTTDGTCEILPSGIGTTSGALTLGSGGTNYTMPTSGNVSGAALVLSSSTALAWESKQIIELFKTSSQGISSGQDVIWNSIGIDVGDMSLISGVGINTQTNRYFEITANITLTGSADFAFVDGTGSLISQRYQINPQNSSTSENTRGCITVLHSTYGGVNFQVRLRCITGSGTITGNETSLYIRAI